MHRNQQIGREIDKQRDRPTVHAHGQTQRQTDRGHIHIGKETTAGIPTNTQRLTHINADKQAERRTDGQIYRHTWRHKEG